MKLRPIPPHLQLNLLLADSAPAELSADKNQELVAALVELLLHAANQDPAPSANEGGPHEPEVD